MSGITSIINNVHIITCIGLVGKGKFKYTRKWKCNIQSEIRGELGEKKIVSKEIFTSEFVFQLRQRKDMQMLRVTGDASSFSLDFKGRGTCESTGRELICNSAKPMYDPLTRKESLRKWSRIGQLKGAKARRKASAVQIAGARRMYHKALSKPKHSRVKQKGPRVRTPPGTIEEIMHKYGWSRRLTEKVLKEDYKS